MPIAKIVSSFSQGVSLTSALSTVRDTWSQCSTLRKTCLVAGAAVDFGTLMFLRYRYAQLKPKSQLRTREPPPQVVAPRSVPQVGKKIVVTGWTSDVDDSWDSEEEFDLSEETADPLAKEKAIAEVLERGIGGHTVLDLFKRKGAAINDYLGRMEALVAALLGRFGGYYGNDPKKFNGAFTRVRDTVYPLFNDLKGLWPLVQKEFDEAVAKIEESESEKMPKVEIDPHGLAEFLTNLDKVCDLFGLLPNEDGEEPEFLRQVRDQHQQALKNRGEVMRKGVSRKLKSVKNDAEDFEDDYPVFKRVVELTELCLDLIDEKRPTPISEVFEKLSEGGQALNTIDATPIHTVINLMKGLEPGSIALAQQVGSLAKALGDYTEARVEEALPERVKKLRERVSQELVSVRKLAEGWQAEHPQRDPVVELVDRCLALIEKEDSQSVTEVFGKLSQAVKQLRGVDPTSVQTAVDALKGVKSGSIVLAQQVGGVVEILFGYIAAIVEKALPERVKKLREHVSQALVSVNELVEGWQTGHPQPDPVVALVNECLALIKKEDSQSMAEVFIRLAQAVEQPRGVDPTSVQTAVDALAGLEESIPLARQVGNLADALGDYTEAIAKEAGSERVKKLRERVSQKLVSVRKLAEGWQAEHPQRDPVVELVDRCLALIKKEDSQSVTEVFGKLFRAVEQLRGVDLTLAQTTVGTLKDGQSDFSALEQQVGSLADALNDYTKALAKKKEERPVWMGRVMGALEKLGKAVLAATNIDVIFWGPIPLCRTAVMTVVRQFLVKPQLNILVAGAERGHDLILLFQEQMKNDVAVLGKMEDERAKEICEYVDQLGSSQKEQAEVALQRIWRFLFANPQKIEIFVQLFELVQLCQEKTEMSSNIDMEVLGEMGDERAKKICTYLDQSESDQTEQVVAALQSIWRALPKNSQNREILVELSELIGLFQEQTKRSQDIDSPAINTPKTDFGSSRPISENASLLEELFIDVEVLGKMERERVEEICEHVNQLGEDQKEHALALLKSMRGALSKDSEHVDIFVELSQLARSSNRNMTVLSKMDGERAKRICEFVNQLEGEQKKIAVSALKDVWLNLSENSRHLDKIVKLSELLPRHRDLLYNTGLAVFDSMHELLQLQLNLVYDNTDHYIYQLFWQDLTKLVEAVVREDVPVFTKKAVQSAEHLHKEGHGQAVGHMLRATRHIVEKLAAHDVPGYRQETEEVFQSNFPLWLLDEFTQQLKAEPRKD